MWKRQQRNHKNLQVPAIAHDFPLSNQSQADNKHVHINKEIQISKLFLTVNHWDKM